MFLRKMNGFEIAIFKFYLLIGFTEISRAIATSGDRSAGTNDEHNKIAASFVFNMDRSVNPCTNFYQFACGNFIKNTVLKDDENIIDVPTILANEVHKNLKQSITTIGRDVDTPHKLMHNFYRSCTNTTKIKEIGAKEVLQIMESLGGWPAVKGNSWTKTDFDWVDAYKKLHILGYDDYIFFKTQFPTGFKYAAERSMSYVRILSPRSFDDNQHLIDGETEKFEAYLNHMTDIATAFGASKDQRDTIKNEMSQVLNFEKEILNLTPNRYQKARISLQHLNRISPNVPWLRYINSQMVSWMTVKETDFVVVPRNFIRHLGSVIARTSNRTIANYVMFQVAKSSLPYLTDELSALKLVSGNAAEKRLERWEKCVKDTQLFKMATRSVYVQDHLRPEAAEDAHDIAKRVMDEYRALFDTNNYMDSESKTKAAAKIDNTVMHIGYWETVLNFQKLEEYYEGLEISQNFSYLKNALNIHKFNDDRSFELLRKSDAEFAYQDIWTETSIDSNLYYLPSPNLFVPAGIIQGPMYNKDRPKYVNYGTLGHSIAFEIGTGFDAKGINIDETGSERLWLTEKNHKNFSQRIECLARQHSNFTKQVYDKEMLDSILIKVSVDGILGARAARRAYEQWVTDNGEEQKLPGIPESQRKLFWLSMANIFCVKKRPDFKDYFSDNVGHEFFISNVLRNSPEFAKDYECPPGSEMNPLKPCPIW